MALTTAILLFVHVLLFVFWIGTDVGVFVLGKIGQDARHSPRRRAESFETALVLDRLPRICFALMLPVGATLAEIEGLWTLGRGGLALIWLVGLLWLACVHASIRLTGGPVFTAMRTIDRLIQASVCLAMLGVGLPSLLGAGPLATPWFALKLSAFGALAAAALALDFLSSPVPAMFQQLAEQGATPALDQRIHARMNRIYVLVGLIYATALTAAFCGITKLPA